MVAAPDREVYVRLHSLNFVANAARSGLKLQAHQVKDVLREWGFRQVLGDLWRCNESQLACLAADEILQVAHCDSPGRSAEDSASGSEAR